VTDKAAFLAAGLDLLMAQLPVPDGVRLLGLTLSGIMGEADEVQPSLL
jgi:DNA polymerase-4